MSTFGPYAFLVTTSGAIQYGVPTMVLRLLCSGVIWAQKPKSAVESKEPAIYSGKTLKCKESNKLSGQRSQSVLSLTEFNWSIHSQQHIITLDVSVDDLVGV